MQSNAVKMHGPNPLWAEREIQSLVGNIPRGTVRQVRQVCDIAISADGQGGIPALQGDDDEAKGDY